jgi:hypothetical protein
LVSHLKADITALCLISQPVLFERIKEERRTTPMMRNIPFAFLDEATLEVISRHAHNAQPDIPSLFGSSGVQELARVHQTMRGLPSIDAEAGRTKKASKRIVTWLDKMMECSGPNSIANLERALRVRPTHES